MTDQPVTPDREALKAALRAVEHALDRARQQGEERGREKAAQAIEAYAAELRRRTDALGSRLLRVDVAARLARGGPNRKDEE